MRLRALIIFLLSISLSDPQTSPLKQKHTIHTIKYEEIVITILQANDISNTGCWSKYGKLHLWYIQSSWFNSQPFRGSLSLLFPLLSAFLSTKVILSYLKKQVYFCWGKINLLPCSVNTCFITFQWSTKCVPVFRLMNKN